MSIEKHRLGDAHKIFDQYLALHNMRRTQERFMVLDCARAMGGHFTADDIAQALNRANTPVATGTVYTTLRLITDCGLLAAHNFDDGINRYEATTHPHMHLVCSQCGKIKDVSDGALDTLIRSRRFTAFTPEQISLTIYGTCSACSRQAKKNKNNITTISKSHKRK